MTGQIAVCGMGLLGGFGAGKEAALRALRSGGGPNGKVSCLPAGTGKMLPAYLADTALLENYLDKRTLRRVNRYSKMALLGACMALEDAGCGIPVDSDRLGVIVASGYGALTTTFDFLDSMIDDGDALASPQLFSNSVHSSAAAHLTILLNIHGPCLTVSQFEMSGITALITAQQWLATGAVDAVLVGAVEEINSVMSYCYDQFFEHTPDVILPGNFDAQTAVMGEGACFLLLRRAAEELPAQACLEHINWSPIDQLSRPADAAWVLGADGHPCCSKHYRNLPQGLFFSPHYGSMPSGQLFDVAFSILASQLGIIATPIRSIKTDKEGHAGELWIVPGAPVRAIPNENHPMPAGIEREA